MWVPWALWQAYGDLQVLSDQYESMTAHVHRVESLLSPTGLWDTGSNSATGWIQPHLPTIRSAAKRTTASWRPPASTATFESLTEIRGHLDVSGDGEHFAKLAERTKTAFNDHYVNDDGTIHSDAETCTRWRSSSSCSTWRQHSCRGSDLRSSWRRAASTSRPASPALRTFSTR